MKAVTERPAPVVIIGMHRSGTSLVSRIVGDAGIHMGWIQQQAEEATFFTGQNKFLLRAAGTSWQHPEHFSDLLESAAAVKYCQEYLEYQLESPRRLSYLGPRRFMTVRDLKSWTGPWGWKDPRNTFTLPIWKRIFPDLRVIHVLRHGVDVARSLEVRSKESLRAGPQLTGPRRVLTWFDHRTRGIDYIGAQERRNGVDLWHRYVAQANDHLEKLGDQSITLRFEDLCREPRKELQRLEDWLEGDVSVTNFPIEEITESRRFAYKSDEELKQFAETVRDDLQEFGYDSEGFA